MTRAEELCGEAFENIQKLNLSIYEKNLSFDEAESLAIKAMELLRDAMNYSESGPIFDIAHRNIDEIGKWKRVTLGCNLSFVDGNYTNNCPLPHAHMRFGLSIGFENILSVCSICEEKLGTCKHILGNTYEEQTCGLIHQEVVVHEISIVDTPKDPNARFVPPQFSMATMHKKLGKKFEPGTPISCDICLNGCPGLTTLPNDSPSFESKFSSEVIHTTAE